MLSLLISIPHCSCSNYTSYNKTVFKVIYRHNTELDAKDFAAPKIVSKAANIVSSFMHRTPLPATARNCFEMAINTFRIRRKVGAGDTITWQMPILWVINC